MSWTLRLVLLCCVIGLSCSGDKSGSRSDDGDESTPGDGDGDTPGDGDGDTPGDGDGDTPGDGGTRDAGGDGDGDGDVGEDPKPTDYLTRSRDDARTGANLHETILNTGNVNDEQFGKLFELEVDDKIYTQLLYVTDLSIAGARHNVLYAATVNNTIYAFDADAPGEPLWKRNFNGEGRPTRNNEVGQACGNYRDFVGNIGIVGTPVIDRRKHTMYFITRTVEGGNTYQTLRAIDIVSGQDRVAPVVVKGKLPGNGRGAIDGQIEFDAKIENQRMSLALHNGVVYAAWAGFCDTGDYHGWLMAFDTATLARVGIRNFSPNFTNQYDGWAAGIWQAGAAPVFDENGDLFLATGNGDYSPSVEDYGQCVLKLKARTLEVLDHFAPSNFEDINQADWDLGSAGPTRLPGTDQIILAGKEGKAYLLNMKNLGKFQQGDTQIPQRFQLVSEIVRPNATHHLHNSVVTWEGPAGLHVYAAGENDYMRMLRYNTTTKKLDVVSMITSDILPPLGMPGGMLALSADGKKAGTGIVWSTTPRSGDANQNVAPGILRAYNAENLKMLWESNSAADDSYEFAKWNNPTIANGKVYIASFANVILAYGLRTPKPAPLVNLAVGASATGSEACNPLESAAKIVDQQIYQQDGDDHFKFCSRDPSGISALIDLGSAKQFSKIVVHHASMGGETTEFNTRAFTVSVGTTPATMESVADVTDNSAARTIHLFTARSARYIRLDVSIPSRCNGGGCDAARIYEVEVFDGP